MMAREVASHEMRRLRVRALTLSSLQSLVKWISGVGTKLRPTRTTILNLCLIMCWQVEHQIKTKRAILFWRKIQVVVEVRLPVSTPPLVQIPNPPTLNNSKTSSILISEVNRVMGRISAKMHLKVHQIRKYRYSKNNKMRLKVIHFWKILVHRIRNLVSVTSQIRRKKPIPSLILMVFWMKILEEVQLEAVEPTATRVHRVILMHSLNDN